MISLTKKLQHQYDIKTKTLKNISYVVTSIKVIPVFLPSIKVTLQVCLWKVLALQA